MTAKQKQQSSSTPKEDAKQQAAEEKQVPTAGLESKDSSVDSGNSPDDTQATVSANMDEPKNAESIKENEDGFLPGQSLSFDDIRKIQSKKKK